MASSPGSSLPVQPHLEELESQRPVLPHPLPTHWVTSRALSNPVLLSAKWGKTCPDSLSPSLSLACGQVTCSALGSAQRTAFSRVHLPLATYHTAKGPRPTPLVHPTPTAPAHTYTHTRFHSHGNVVACALTCATQTHLLVSSLAGRLCRTTQVAASLMSTCVQTTCPATRIQTYTLLHGTHTRHPDARRGECKVHVHVCTQVPQDTSTCICTHGYHPGPVQPQNYSGLGPGPTWSVTASSQQAPAPTPGQTKSKVRQIPA